MAKGERRPKKHAQIARSELEHQCKFQVKKKGGVGPCDKKLSFSAIRLHAIHFHLDGIKENWNPDVGRQYFVALEPETAVEKRLRKVEKELRSMRKDISISMDRLEEFLIERMGANFERNTGKRRRDDSDSQSGDESNETNSNDSDNARASEEGTDEKDEEEEEESSAEEKQRDEHDEDEDEDAAERDDGHVNGSSLFGSDSDEEEEEKEEEPKPPSTPTPSLSPARATGAPLVRRTLRMRADNAPPPMD